MKCLIKGIVINSLTAALLRQGFGGQVGAEFRGVIFKGSITMIDKIQH